MAAALASADLVNFLIKDDSYFNSLSLEEKIEIKTAKPTPLLLMTLKDPSGRSKRKFQMSWYANFKWLTGSVDHNRLFCFYCILFSRNKSPEWCKRGVGEGSLKNITSKMKKHESFTYHIFAAVKFNELGIVKIDRALSGDMRLAAIKHNEDVDRNRLIVKRLISTTCFLGRQELAFRQHESDGSLNKGNYLEILDFLAEEESYMKTHLIHSTLFKGTSSETQNEMIESITEVVNELILNEIENAHFVSIQVDETTDVSTESKLSVILRYANVNSGEVEERFVGFYDVSKNKSPRGLADVLLAVLKKWKVGEDKLLCQTYDGATAMAGSTYLYTFIRREYPQALFIHCYAHDLHLVLLHGGKTINPVKLFIANLSAFRSFFSRSSKRQVLLRERGFKLPQPNDTRWNFRSRVVPTILAYFSELKAVMEDVLEKDGWDSNTISLAIGLKRSLNDMQFLFLLHVYNKIFEYTTALVDILQINNTDINPCYTEAWNCIRSLKKLVKKDFVQMCAAETETLLYTYEMVHVSVDIIDDGIKQEEPDTLQLKFDDKLLVDLTLLAFQIIDNVIVNMERRFQDLQKLSIMQVLNEEKFEFYNAFPDHILQKLLKNYPGFDRLQLKGELMFIYGSDDKKMPPKELFKFLINNNLKDVLPETIKLLSLILCFPVTNATGEGSTSTLKRIKRYLRNNMTNERLSDLATLAIEKGLVKTSASQQQFITRTIDVFAEKTQRTELIYKKI